MQMNGVSKEIAAAIVGVHPSPHHLLKVMGNIWALAISHSHSLPQAYESCSTQEGELLLQDVLVWGLDNL